MAKKPLYDWGDGKGKIHTIPKATHAQNVEAKGYGINLNAPASAPLTSRQSYGMAQQAADLQYQPQINAVQNLQQSVPTWYANYQASVAASQAADAARAAPLLQQAQQAAQNPQGTPGLDPNSQQYATDQRAAQGRQAINQSSYNALAAIPLASNAYQSGQALIAARELPGVQSGLAQQYGQLQAQRGQAVATNYAQNRSNEQNAQIAYDTLGLNQNKAAADAAYDAANLQQSAADKKAARVVSRKNTRDRIRAQTEQQNAAKTDKEAAAQAKEKAKQDAKIQAASGKVRNKVTDIIGEWDKGGTVDVTDPKTGKVTGSRKATSQELRSAIVDKYGFMGRIALAIREHRPLDQKAVDYLHNLDPNFRVPREWLGKKSKTPAQDADPHGTGEANERAPGPYGGHI